MKKKKKNLNFIYPKGRKLRPRKKSGNEPKCHPLSWQSPSNFLLSTFFHFAQLRPPEDVSRGGEAANGKQEAVGR